MRELIKKIKEIKEATVDDYIEALKSTSPSYRKKALRDAGKRIKANAEETKNVILIPGFGRVKKEWAEKNSYNYVSLNLKEEKKTGDEQIVQMTVPFLIKSLEWAREMANSDIEVHKFVEKIIAKNKVLTMSDYEDFEDNEELNDAY